MNLRTIAPQPFDAEDVGVVMANDRRWAIAWMREGRYPEVMALRWDDVREACKAAKAVRQQLGLAL